MAFFKLNVPFKDKDEAKKFGAKWYSEDKYWYYSGDELPEGLRRWYPLYKPVDGKEGVYLDTETGEIIGDSSEITPVNYENDDPYAKYRTVSEINRMISDIVNATNEFRAILVKGEVTNFDGKKGRN